MNFFIRAFLYSSFISSVLFILDAFRKDKKKFNYYFCIFLWFFITTYIIYFFFPKALEASEYRYDDYKYDACEFYQEDSILDSELEISILSPIFSKQTLTPEQKKLCLKKMNYHCKEGTRLYKEAQDISLWYLPTLTEKQNADYCFNAAVAVLSATTPMSKLIGVIIATSAQYARDCSDQWRKMQSLLSEAKYHHEMGEFYANAISNG